MSVSALQQSLGTSRAFIGLLLTFAALLLAAPLPPAHSADGQSSPPDPAGRVPAVVDLSMHPAWVTAGFSTEDLQLDPGTLSSPRHHWVRVESRQGRGRPIRIPELDLPGIPERSFLSLRRYAPMEFTILIPFDLEERDVDGYRTSVPARVPGLFLASIGDNWSLYLNGALLSEEIHQTPDGRIRRHAIYRDVVVPFDADLLLPGTNVFAVRVIGDPTSGFTGLRKAGSYLFGPIDEVDRSATAYADVLLIGLYLFVGIYHLFIFVVQRRNRHYLFYALFSIGIATYVFTRTSVIQILLPNHEAVIILELISLYTLVPLLAAFIDTLEGEPVRKVTYGYAFLILLFILTVPAASVPLRYDVLTVWQISALAMGAYLFCYRLVWDFVVHVMARRHRELGSGKSVSWVWVVRKELIETPKGNLLIGGTVLFVSGMFDVVDAAVLHWDVVLTKYGFLLFTLGTAMVLANRLVFLNRRISDLNESLEGRIEEISKTNRELAAGEARYRSLFEGVSDPVALTDLNLAFLALNPAARHVFAHVEGRDNATVVDCIFRDSEDDTFGIQELRSVVADLRESRSVAELQVRFLSPLGEPDIRQVRLQLIGEDEILLRIVDDGHDPMLDCLVRGGEEYEIPSLLSSARAISRRVTLPLSRFLGKAEIDFLAICLNEILINAVEHGSLEVTFDEKSRALSEERYFAFLAERQRDLRFRDRRVRVEWSVKVSQMVFRITDDGPGFDHKRFLARVDDPGRRNLEHGRGLMMALNAFDRVVYNDRGNQVTLVKNLESRDGL